MPKRDVFHDRVKHALIKDGWTITHDPYPMQFGEHRLSMGAEAPIAAEKAGRKIVVAIKGFTGTSDMADFEQGLGRFLLSQVLINRQEPKRWLFLAIPQDVYTALLDTAAGRDFVAACKLRLMLYEPAGKLITRWIE
jgi:hypothetical protein